jgi:hypothetical protein
MQEVEGMANSGMGGSNETVGAGTGLNTDVGFSSPGSPSDEMGTDAMPASGEVGAADPGAGEDITGDAEGRDRGLIDQLGAPQGGGLQPHLTQDSEPERSNISGPTPLEEGRGS